MSCDNLYIIKEFLNGKSMKTEKERRYFREDWPLGEDVGYLQWGGTISALSGLQFSACQISGLD